MIGGSRLAAVALAVAFVGGGLVARRVASPAGGPVLRVIEDVGMGRVVEVRGLPSEVTTALADASPTAAEWQRVLALFVDDSAGEALERPPVLAHYIVDATTVRLVPRFPLTPGVAYRAEVSPEGLSRLAGAPVRFEAASHRFAIPAPRLARTTRVVAVHPSVAEVPANLLRWYVEFSAPMEAGSAHDHVKLLDASGREVPRAFLDVSEELWSPDRRRLTLLFDPGRVKRGIRTNIESGAPLIEGRRYRLTIDAEWRDGRGAMLASGFEHPFQVGAADRASPDPSSWTIHAPPAGTRAALRLTFPEPLDHALLGRVLNVVDASEEPVAGQGVPSDDGRSWSFLPESTWAAGSLAVHVDPQLEDLAGNNVARLFDADLRRRAPVASQVTRLTVTVR